MNKYTISQKILLYLSIAVFLTFILLPFVEMFYASLRPLKHLFRSPYQFYSNDLSFWAYSEMWNTVPRLGRYIFNSFFLASCVAILTLLFVIPAAYSFARFNFPFKNGTLYLLLAVNMFTGPVLIIPLYKMLRTLSLLNTYYAMIVPGVAFLIPTSIWLLKSYFQKIPIELEEAAHVDGAWSKILGCSCSAALDRTASKIFTICHEIFTIAMKYSLIFIKYAQFS